MFHSRKHICRFGRKSDERRAILSNGISIRRLCRLVFMIIIEWKRSFSTALLLVVLKTDPVEERIEGRNKAQRQHSGEGQAKDDRNGHRDKHQAAAKP